MKKSCLISLAVFLVVYAVYFYVLNSYLLTFKIKFIFRLFIPLLGAVSVTLMVSAILQLFPAWRRLRAIKRALSGLPFEDGKVIAAIGEIHPEAAALTSPITGVPCVAFDYKVFTYYERIGRGRGEPVEDMRYGGTAMCPCSIQSRQGSVRLLGFPTLDLVKERVFNGEDARDHFLRYAASAKFEEARGGLNKFKEISKLEELLTDDDGTVGRDWRLGDEPGDWSNFKFREKKVEVGTEVVAFGRYSAERRGIFNKLGFGGEVNDLYIGNPARAKKEIRGKTLFLLVFAIVYFSFFHGIFGLLIFAPPKP